MAECLDTAVTALLNCEVAEFLADRRAARKESQATMGRTRPGHHLRGKEARWLESKARTALAVLSGDMSAALSAADALRAATPPDLEGAEAVERCAREAIGWQLGDAQRVQLVNLRCVSDVEGYLVLGSLVERMGDDGVALCVRAVRALLPPPPVSFHSPAGSAAGAGAPVDGPGVLPGPAVGGSGSRGRSVRFRESGRASSASSAASSTRGD
ncbi:unnamed protein product [Symbiodinium sp. KB8]|nr:unnamed protein product [Symbiodinium sp. KB8]